MAHRHEDLDEEGQGAGLKNTECFLGVGQPVDLVLGWVMWP